jgi:NADH-quinone oxidoreductase subunit N
MYFDEPAAAFDRHVGGEIRAVTAIAAIVIMFFFLFPAPIVAGAQAASAALFP